MCDLSEKKFTFQFMEVSWKEKKAFPILFNFNWHLQG